MHVLELLANFLFTPHIEVIKSGLPEARQIPVACCKCAARLPCRRATSASPEIPRDALLQHFQDDAGCALGGFADEQMNVVGHDHISDQQEIIALTNFPHGLDEYFSRSPRVDQRNPSITTEREEMQMAPSIVSLQTFRHKTNPHAYPRRVGHPSFLNEPVDCNSA